MSTGVLYTVDSMSKATVIFDFDGTLANSVDLMVSLYNEHADEFGYERVKKSEFPELRRLGYRKAMKKKKLKLRVVAKMVPILSKEMRSRIDEVDPYEGIVDALYALREAGHPIGVLTSNQAPLVKDFFKQHDFPPFDFVVSEKTLFGKDKALRRIIKRYQLDVDDVIYVGDEPRDVAASHKASVQVIGVSWGLAGKEGFAKNVPDVIVSTNDELLTAIDELSS